MIISSVIRTRVLLVLTLFIQAFVFVFVPSHICQLQVVPWESCANTLVNTNAQPLSVIQLFTPTSIDQAFWYKCSCTYKYVLRRVVKIYLYLQISGQRSCTNTLIPTNSSNYKCIYSKLQINTCICTMCAVLEIRSYEI